MYVILKRGGDKLYPIFSEIDSTRWLFNQIRQYSKTFVFHFVLMFSQKQLLKQFEWNISSFSVNKKKKIIISVLWFSLINVKYVRDAGYVIRAVIYYGVMYVILLQSRWLQNWKMYFRLLRKAMCNICPCYHTLLIQITLSYWKSGNIM